MQILIHSIRAPLSAPPEEVIAQALRKIAPLCPRTQVLSAQIYKRSVDARHTDRITLVYTVSVLLSPDAAPDPAALAAVGAEAVEDTPCSFPIGTAPLSAPPVVVGMGPAGLFAALLLARNGYRPIVIERGDPVGVRTEKVAHFRKTGELDPESNVQFGAGGAGTFSDGKLMTRIHDPLCRSVLADFVRFGAAKTVLTEAKPHIGTDCLRGVIEEMTAELLRLGATLHYRTALQGIKLQNGRVVALQTSKGEIACGAVIVAIGHSARDTYRALAAQRIVLVEKPFSVGVRIEHLQDEVDRALYGRFADHPALSHAEYAFSHRGRDAKGTERGVYTFCMCPGGQVIPSASEIGGVVTNGMSVSARDGRNANSALVVSVTPEDCAALGLSTVGYQRALEEKAYRMAGGGYRAPIQTVGDFLSGKSGTAPTKVIPTYGAEDRLALCDLRALFPEYITSFLQEGILRFDKKMRGFASPTAVLTGVESRTSSPIRMLRGEDYTAPDAENLYPCGEGAGYAGGITSAAVDGIRCAAALMARYHN